MSLWQIPMNSAYLLNGEAHFLCEWKYWKSVTSSETLIEYSEAVEGLIKQKYKQKCEIDC